MAVKIAPDARRQFVNASGVPYSGAKLFYYASGSTTKQNTYTTSAGNVANSNPIVLDSAGRTPFGVWLTAGLTYKEVLAPSTDTDPPGSPIYTEDGISGINDTSVTVSQWAASALTPTYISGTSFSVAGDQTTELHIGRRLQLSVTAGTVYARISNSVYGALTTVTVVMDSGALDSGLSSFNWSILTAANHALPKLTTTLLSAIGIANTTDYAPLASPTFTGTPLSTTAAVDTSTTQIATTAFVRNQAASAAPLVNAATAVVGTSGRYARGDHVHPGAGLPSSKSEVEAATSNVTTVTPLVLQYHPGVAKAWVQFNSVGTIISSHNVTSVTRGGVGNFTVNFITSFSSSSYALIGFATDDNGAGASVITRWTGDTKTAAACQIRAAEASAGGAVDPEFSCVMFFGGQ